MVDDEAVGLALQRGDEAALAALYDRYGQAVYRLALRITGDAVTAEVVSLDTFLQVWRQTQRYNAQHGTLASWVLSIARSRAIDRKRTADAARRLQGEGGSPAAQVQIPEMAELAQRQRVVREALDSLDAAQRRALELAYYEGLAPAQIAERLGEPLATVKTRIRQAMNLVRKTLANASTEVA